MLDAATLLNLGEKGAKAVAGLLSVAKTGVADMLQFPDAMTQTLALEIMALWRQAQAPDVIDVAVDKKITDVTLKFGPDRQYRLVIPVTGPIAKKEVAASLRSVADTLDPPTADDQLPLPFAE